MKKYFYLLLTAFMFFSCNNYIATPKLEEPKYHNYKKNRNANEGGFDPYPFFDVTMKNVNASDIVIEDFNAIVNRKYKNQKGSVITFNVQKGTVSYTGNNEHNVSFTYKYEIKAASKNLIYICPADKMHVKINYDGKEISSKEFSQFALYIPLYGFGQGRLEVSKHLKNESLINCGTYWNIK